MGLIEMKTATITEKGDFSREGVLTALASEKSLAKDWLSKEDDEAWKSL